MTDDERAKVLGAIARANPRARVADLVVFGNAWVSYLEAQENIAAHGEIVAHPRTGAPIENPFAKVRDRAAAVIARYGRLKVPKGCSGG